MAPFAPPIAVARARATFWGQGAPGSVALCWARAAKAHARRTSGTAGKQERALPATGAGRETVASKGAQHRRTQRTAPVIRCYLSRPREVPVNHPLRKVVIPAAGLGTRFLPATKAVPKEMLPIVDTPTLQMIVEEALRAGAEQVVVVNGRGKGAIEDHFDRSYELETELRNKGKTELFQQIRRISDSVRLISIRQKEPLGLGHAVLAARHAVGNEWFGVMLGDDLVDGEDPAIGQLARLSQETGKATVALMPVPESQVHLYGVGGGKPFRDGHIVIDRIVEKPKRADAPSNLAVIGRYVLPPDIFDVLANLKPGAIGEIQLTDGLAALAREGRLLGVRFTGTRYDAGDRLGYLQANIAYALKRPDLRDGLVSWLREVIR